MNCTPKVLCSTFGMQFSYLGRVNQNSDPLPSSEFTPIVPPNSLTIISQMESPNPVPCSNKFSLVNRSKIIFC